MHAPQVPEAQQDTEATAPADARAANPLPKPRAAGRTGQRYVGGDARHSIRRRIDSPGSGGSGASPPHTRASVAGLDGLGRFRHGDPLLNKELVRIGALAAFIAVLLVVLTTVLGD